MQVPPEIDLPPPHLRLSLLALVFVGGAAGTLARWGIGQLVPQIGPLPAGTFVANVVGAFVLGFVLEHLAGRGPDAGRLRGLRLTVGTGFCGGFTTYSALSVESAALLRTGLVGPAVAYALGTVVLGVAASALGVRVGRPRETA